MFEQIEVHFRTKVNYALTVASQRLGVSTFFLSEEWLKFDVSPLKDAQRSVVDHCHRVRVTAMLSQGVRSLRL